MALDDKLQLPVKAWGDQNGRITCCWQYACQTQVGYPSAEFDFQVYQELVNILCLPGTADAGLIPVTNRVPDLYPWSHVMVVVLGQPNLGWRNAAGNAPAKVVMNVNAGTPTVVYIGWRADPKYLAAGIAHECVHAFQTPDGGDVSHEGAFTEDGRTPNLMSTTAPVGGRLSAARIARVKQTVKRFADGDRFGAYLPKTGGQWSVGWSNLKDSSFFSVGG